jgi:hypothetical protein
VIGYPPVYDGFKNPIDALVSYSERMVRLVGASAI